MANLNATIPTLAISENFFDSLNKLPPKAMKAISNFISKFRNNPTSKGIHYEAINNAASNDYRSARVTDDYRMIIKQLPDSNIYLLLYVGKHDDAYDWATTHKCEANASTGAVQVFSVAPGGNLPQEKDVPSTVQETRADSTSDLFGGFNNIELMSIGVPPSCIRRVQRIKNTQELQKLSSDLPSDAFDSLMELAAGKPLEEVAELFGKNKQKLPEGKEITESDAVLKPNERTLRSFKIIEPDAFLEEITPASLASWRIFLHPSQKSLAENKSLAPKLVRGVAGTGKTVVALYRAAYVAGLIPKDSTEKVLVTTFTKNLAVDISNQLDQICQPHIRSKIEVIHFDAWVMHFLKQNNCSTTILYPSEPQYQTLFEAALKVRNPELSLPEDFYRSEWRRVILPQAVQSETDYFKASRKGRGVILSRAKRKEIWPVFEEMRRLLSIKKYMTFEDACVLAQSLVEENHGLCQYKSVIVDETQDFDEQALKLLALIAKENPEDEPSIFLVGDSHQRIYARQASLGACGINVRGRRSARLKLVYRTTEEIRALAETVLLGQVYDNMDGEPEAEEEVKESFGLRHGRRPVFIDAANLKDEVDKILNEIRQADYSDDEVCVVFRTNNYLKNFKAELDARGVPNAVVKTSEDMNRRGIRLATMHRVKGLEFKMVFIADCNADVVPLKKALQSSADKSEERQNELAERSLFYVACSRARDYLGICFTGEPSPYIGWR